VTDHRYDDGAQSCPCLPGYYDSGGRTCPLCHITCATCTGGAANNCLTCPNQTTTFRNITANSCPCIAGYYHSGGVVCSLCHYSCQTCDTTAVTCTSCSPTLKRVLTSQRCTCDIGFYDDGFSLMCQPCFSTCRTCNGPTVTDCTSCWANASRALNSPTG
jgi:proprotein convertase subtilisin/kexin type 5